MYIVRKSLLDFQNRIVITELFEKMPEEVRLAVDFEKKQIVILDEDRKIGTKLLIDKKNRLAIPKWIIEEVGDCKEFLLIIDGNRRLILPKKGDIIE